MPHSPTKRPRAYSYIRMSTDMQLKGDSLRRQMEASRRYADAHNLDLVEGDELQDIGVSAFKGANVSGGSLGRFLEAVRAKKVPDGSYLLVESLDRLSRQEVMKSLAVFTDIINSGINIATLADGQLYRAGNTDFTQLIMSIVIMGRAHEESQTKSHRLSAAWVNKRRNADARKLTGQCPGWLRLSNDKKAFEIIEDRVAVVRSIFEESLAGIGNYSIARRLNERGVAPFRKERDPTGSATRNGWQTSSINKLLSNRAVLGEFQPHRLVNGKQVPEGPVIPDYFPPIIDQALFFRAQAARSQRRVGGGGRRGEFISNLFSGIARCAYCESRMHFVNKGPGPKGGSYLVCDRARRGLGCEKTGWRYEQFEASFLGFVQELDLEDLIHGDEETSKRAALDQLISKLEGERSELRRQQERTYELLMNAGGSSPFLEQKLSQCETRLTAVTAEIAKAAEQRDSLRSDVSRFYESKEQIKALIARLSQRDDAEVYKLRAQIASRLRSLVTTLLVAPAGRVPTAREVLNLVAQDPDAGTLMPGLLDQMRDDLDDDRAKRRCFIVMLKGGAMRGVYPHADDPLRFEEQICRSEFGVHRINGDEWMAPSAANFGGYTAKIVAEAV